MKITAHAVSSAVVLFTFWLLLSGHFTPFLVTMGALSAVAIVALGRRMEVIDREGHPIDMGWRVLGYWPWLMKEIVKSAWDVSRIIVDPRLPISPRLVRAKTSQKTAVGVVTYANSITLTPGTISVDVRAGEILVHALTRESAAGLLEGEMDRRVTRFEGRS
ncbi:MAG TPA: Na+/H+ antiporter subunit E [Burkholderiales bacterium]|nr:Na+/H+ antiporter subunit E [Burkholderiales bacterium]